MTGSAISPGDEALTRTPGNGVPVAAWATASSGPVRGHGPAEGHVPTICLRRELHLVRLSGHKIGIVRLRHVLQAPEDRDRNDAAVALPWSRALGRIAVEGPVRPGFVVIHDELAHEPS